MILEVAVLNVRAGQSQAFEQAFAQAQDIISSMPGYVSHQLQRCIDVADRYVLLVNWRHLEDHTVGFRQSLQYQQWKTLLHHFYDPFPSVEHYQHIFSGSATEHGPKESVTREFRVAETFLSLGVADMDRAVAFYSRSLGAATKWASPRWSSLELAGVRIGLFGNSQHGGGRVGLHFAVTNLDAACASIERAGGRIVPSASQVAPGVFVAEACDTEGNIFSIQKASS